MLCSIFFILPLLVPSLHASPINKLRARYPPSIPKGSICFFTLNDAPMGNLHSKLTGADIQLHGKEEFCVLKAEEEKFNELEKIESVEDKTSLTTVIVHPGDKIWISAETLAREDLFEMKCFSSDEGSKICDAKLEILTEKWNIVDKMPLLADLTHYTSPPRNYTWF
ncbi:hypothetical protein C8J55DRAFT_527161 [Lentinula edodes]|uniref:Uncharacterized protein n=1 Tax=Lentinula lateritia TaxID=40482 RepID=A0A9W9DF19_9AGAR|nr:hypothetical protein C8J55DRAFT_527161 [Lentinula edodes]